MNKKITIGMLIHKPTTWVFYYEMSCAEFSVNCSPFGVMQKLAEEGWEPVMCDQSHEGTRYYFKKIS